MTNDGSLWISVAERRRQIAALHRGKPRKQFVVLGAGMAGLVAAYELQCLGHQVSIIEAADRVGGRVRTHRFESGQYGELGAMRIPGSC
jgi:monoamine oxidase